MQRPGEENRALAQSSCLVSLKRDLILRSLIEIFCGDLF